jgi:group II intron reverse transcriptase/maturase
MSRSPNLGSISTRRQRIARLAREDRERSFLSLAHYIDEPFLHVAFARTRKDAAPGVDGQTAAEYAKGLTKNLRSLLDRFKSGRYKAQPVRRRHIPKGSGRDWTRPIGVPSFEDKVLQRAVVMVLEPIFEQDFLDCSYGFRPGRSAHQALADMWKGLMKMGGGWVLEIDIQGFFDELDRAQLRSFLDRRVRDGVIRRTIDKWLKAGVMEEGRLSHPETGTPQGSVISPLLANLYLHEVLDQWFEEEVRSRLHGRAFLTRFADDAVLSFERQDDARRVFAVLPKRFGRFGLRLHPEKTRLVPFRHPARESLRSKGPGSFAFLGFTHYWARSRRGNWVVKRKTAASRQRRALREIGRWCRRHRHQSVAWQHWQLSRKLRGHYAYYGITGNSRALGAFWYQTRRSWRKWLNRRSNRARMTWTRFERLTQRYPLPGPKIVHLRQTA